MSEAGRVSAVSRRAAALAMLSVLAACATRGPTAPGTWSGRLALRVDSQPPQAFSALFDLRGNADQGELQLSSIIGQTLATVAWAPSGAQLRRGSQVTRRGSLDELTQELTGAPLPVRALFDWLAGQPSEVSGWRADLGAHADGRIVARREQPAPSAELRLVVQP